MVLFLTAGIWYFILFMYLSQEILDFRKILWRHELKSFSVPEKRTGSLPAGEKTAVAYFNTK